ncbi:MAG: DUF1559 domain-containing protein [Planctomycetota bacterium]
MAFNNHYATFGHFPVGADSKPDPLVATTPHNFYRWSALAHITPYLGEERAHDLIDFNTPMYRNTRLNPEVSTAVATRLSIFLCPSDIEPFPVSDNGGTNYGLTNYVICAGTGNGGGTPFETDGIFYVNSRTRIKDIIDGTSHTVLVSES